MMMKHLDRAALAAGGLTVAWVAWGYLGHHPLALTMTLLIGAFFALGVLELRRFGRASAALAAALQALPDPLERLEDWLAALPEGLRDGVRERIESGRAVLPGPALTPYLVGLLVLLGMLGTFLGMVVTLNGAVLALESTTDLAAIRAALAAPVKGLGVAFGTSVAGAAASAMLGLMSALARRQRQQVLRGLDRAIGAAAGPLRRFSRARQREDALHSLQAQAQLMPALAQQMQQLMTQMERHSEQLGSQWLAGQERFHRESHEIHAALASSVEQSLRDSLVESARLAGATIQPAVEGAMGALAEQTTTLHRRLADSVGAQLEGLSGRFDTAVTSVAQVWQQSLAQQGQAQAEQQAALAGTLAAFGQRFELGSAALLAGVEQRQAAAHAALADSAAELAASAARQQAAVAAAMQAQLDGVAERFAASVGQVSAGWSAAQQEQVDAQRSQAAALQQALAGFAETFEQRSTSLLVQVQNLQTERLGAQDQAAQQRLDAWTRQLGQMGAQLQAAWQQATAQLHSRREAELGEAAERHARWMDELQALGQTLQQGWQAQMVAAQAREQQAGQAEQQRLAAWTTGLEALGERLQAAWEARGEAVLAQQTQAQDQAAQQQAAQAAQWQQTGTALEQGWRTLAEQTLARQAELAEAMAATARQVGAETEAQARRTIDEVAQLARTAAEAPKAAAGIVELLQQRLADSVQRDNALLDERQRLLGSLAEVLAEIRQASEAQRGAMAGWLDASAQSLQQAGSQFGAAVEAATATLAGSTVQLGGSAAEVASLGEVLGGAVQRFGEASGQLVGQLERIEGALDQAMQRSDEQLAYTVAQARELIDLSVLSSKRLVDEMQQISRRDGALAEAR